MLLIDMNINRKAPTTQPRSATAAGMEISSNHQTSLWFGFMEWRCGACWPCDLWWFRAWWALMIFDVILTPFRCHVSTGSILAVPHHPNSLIGVSWHRNRFCPIPTSLPVPVFFWFFFCDFCDTCMIQVELPQILVVNTFASFSVTCSICLVATTDRAAFTHRFFTKKWKTITTEFLSYPEKLGRNFFRSEANTQVSVHASSHHLDFHWPRVDTNTGRGEQKFIIDQRQLNMEQCLTVTISAHVSSCIYLWYAHWIHH